MTLTSLALAVYAAGALLALVKTDAGPGTRVLLALTWPVAPAAFALTVASLVAVGMVAFPVFGVAVVAVAGAAWYFF